MAEISAELVKKLRMETNAPMMECKKALVEANGNFSEALQILKVRLGNKVSKVSSRTAAEGILVSYTKGNIGVLLEINSETDFVAKQGEFVQFAKDVAQAAAASNVNDVEALKHLPLNTGTNAGTIEAERTRLVGKIGENIVIRRFVRCESAHSVVVYIHSDNKKGALVEYKGNDAQLGKNIAMHIVAMNPVALSAKEVPAELIAEKRRIFEISAKESGKPAEIIAKMTEGSMSKFLKEVSLLDQAFVCDDKQSIAQILKSNDAEIFSFTRYELGEGIEKQVTDFASEVAEQIAAAAK